MGGHRLVLESTCLEEHLNLSKSGFVSEEGHSGCKSQNIAIRALKGNFLFFYPEYNNGKFPSYVLASFMRSVSYPRFRVQVFLNSTCDTVLLIDVNITCSMTTDIIAKLARVSEKNSSSSDATGNLCQTK